jgi:predicted permease
MFRPVSRGYFRGFRIPLLEGRTFRQEDRIDQDGVMVVNKAFVNRYFPEGDALGQRIRFDVGQVPGAPREFTVVGVVGNVRFNGFRQPAEPAFYAPLSQFPYGAMKIHLKASVPPETLSAALKDRIWSLDPKLPVTDVRTMKEITTSALARDRFNAVLLGAFALAALALAAGGAFGVLSYLVARRTPELGVRMALGAEPAAILNLVVRDGLFMAGLGVVSGALGALLLAPLMASVLFGVPPRDPGVLLIVILALGLVALFSGFIPAWRASRTSPSEALRPG